MSFDDSSYEAQKHAEIHFAGAAGIPVLELGMR
jgi:hypothetical protein